MVLVCFWNSMPFEFRFFFASPYDLSSTGLTFLQGGFSLLEAGGIRKRNVSNVLFKNLLDTVIAAIAYYCVGYAFAYGEDVNGFIGRSYFALSELPAREFYLFFFQFAFVATAATIANNFIDFAGSTIVHAVGGMASLVASIFLGARLERKKKFDNKDFSPIPGRTLSLE